MKKTAVLLYDSFCNFEISPALEVLALSKKAITVFGTTKEPIKSEDGLTVIPDDTIENINLNEYDSLLLPGAMDIRESIENKSIIEFIKKFDGKVIGAISIAPCYLSKLDCLMENLLWRVSIKRKFMKKGFPRMI